MFLFLSLLVISIPFFLLLWNNGGRRLHRPPGPYGLPFIGNMHQMDTKAPYIKLFQLAKKHGPFMSFQLGSVPFVVISSSKFAKEIMKTHDLAFSSRPVMLGQQKLSYNNINVTFAPYGPYWREMKKIYVHHLLGVKAVQSFRAAREDEVSRTIKKITQLAQKSKVVNLSEELVSQTNTLICRIAFGTRYMEDNGYDISRFCGLFNETQALLGGFAVRDFFPYFGWMDRLTGLSKRLEKTSKDLNMVFDELIDAHLPGERPESSEKDLIDILLQLKKDGSTSFEFTLDHIKAMILDIFVGGTDTVVAATIWVMTMLAKNPTAMARVQQEVRMVKGRKDAINEDDLHKFVYLKAVIKETLRMYPPAPLVLRETINSCVIEGYEIHPKTSVFINIWAIGRDPETWENPESFVPERFLGKDIDFRGHDYEFIPFGSGRRSCPGINMAVPTVELTLANLLCLFDWELPPGMAKEDIDTDGLPGLVMHKKNDLCLVATNYY